MSRDTIVEGDGDPRHGTVAGYRNNGCSCPDCTAANTDGCLSWRDRNPDAWRQIQQRYIDKRRQRRRSAKEEQQ